MSENEQRTESSIESSIELSNERLTELENLLGQMQLSEPSSRLDDAISGMAGTESLGTVSATLPPSPSSERSSWFSYSSVVATVVASIILLMVIGAYVTDSSAQVLSFQQLHGHSGLAKFSDCSTCHQFASRDTQIIEHWRPAQGIHKTLGAKCSTCHQTKKENAKTPEHFSNPHALPVESFNEFHGHSTRANFSDCAQCHSFGDKQTERIEKWQPSEQIQEELHSNCSMCHQGGA